MDKVISKIKYSVRSRRKQIPMSLRTTTGEMYYAFSKKMGNLKNLSDEPALEVWEHWRLIDNSYPYDIAFKTHHLLIPKRVTPKHSLNVAEKLELEDILDSLSERYDCYLENFASKQSIKNHYHLHLLTYKDNRADMRLH